MEVLKMMAALAGSGMVVSLPPDRQMSRKIVNCTPRQPLVSGVRREKPDPWEDRVLKGYDEIVAEVFNILTGT
jgi:hypothetical protein